MIETIFFPIVIILIGFTTKYYILILFAAIFTAYYQARKPIINEYSLNHFLKNKRYKATMISIEQQIGNIIQGLASIGIGFLMGISFKLGYILTGIILFLLLIISYNFTKKWIK